MIPYLLLRRRDRTYNYPLVLIQNKMKEFLIFIIFISTLSGCCTEVYFKTDETFWFDKYDKGDKLIFESNNGDLDTVIITNKIIKKPTGECNPMVSTYDKEFVRIDYQIKKDSFKTHKGWLVQHSAETEDKTALPVLRFINMEYNQWEGSLKQSEIQLANKKKVKVFVFDESNCGMNYNQNFRLINFKWSKQMGIVSYENNIREIWRLKLK